MAHFLSGVGEFAFKSAAEEEKEPAPGAPSTPRAPSPPRRRLRQRAAWSVADANVTVRRLLDAEVH